jgi:hypothetical protein
VGYFVVNVFEIIGFGFHFIIRNYLYEYSKNVVMVIKVVCFVKLTIRCEFLI